MKERTDIVSEADAAALRQQIVEFQERLCEERHGTLDSRLDKVEKNLDRMLWWLIGIMGTALLNLLILVIRG
jgi:CHASE3 domain sensor protein